MTVKYILTKGEIVRAFLIGMGKSPRIFLIVLAICVWPAAVWLFDRRVWTTGLRFTDVPSILGWMVGAFCFLLALISIKGKTVERTLVTSDQGIATEIGRFSGKVRWAKVKQVTETDRHILIIGTSGNSFFIPNRAFEGEDGKNQFLAEVRQWRASV